MNAAARCLLLASVAAVLCARAWAGPPGNPGWRRLGSRWRTRLRTLPALSMLFLSSRKEGCSVEELRESIATVRQRGLAKGSHASRTLGLWRLETLGYAYSRSETARLAEARIPREVQPIVHVGLGIAATEAGAFSAPAISSIIEARSHPDYRLFAHEAVGCLWAVRADRWLRRVFRGVVRASIPASPPLPWEDFVACSPPPIRRLLAHGYGRTLYFRNAETGRALRAARQVPGLDVPAALQGISFASVMVNHRDLDRLLEAESGLADAPLAAAFDRGRVHALALWEWTWPSFLSSLPAAGPRTAGLVAEARDLIARSLEAGALKAFVGEDGE